MTLFSNRTRFFLIIGMLLVGGFTASSLLSYFAANQSLNDNIKNHVLPLTGDNIYSEIQRDVLPTVIIASLMAQDTFVRDWIIAGETNSHQMSKYLKTIEQRYDTATAFFVSEKTRRYYHSSGVLKTVNANDAQDTWYFRVRQMENDYEINVDTDTAVKTQTNIFINHKIYDYNNNYLGAIGVGLSSETVINLIRHYQSAYNRQVYFTDKKGDIMLSGSGYLGENTIYNTPGLAKLTPSILHNSHTSYNSYTYRRANKEVLLEARFINELDWYLFVEQVVEPEAKVTQAFWINMLIHTLVSLLVLGLVYMIIHNYQDKLENMATLDKLTGVANRHGFEPLLKQAMKSSQRNKESLSILIVDIDHFKRINDDYGHVIGDEILAQFAKTLQTHQRESDLLCRWGGEEFLIALPQCNIDNATLIAEKLSTAINQETYHVDEHSISISVSIGIAQFAANESSDNLFKRADTALYQAKNSGRNRVKAL